MSSKLQSLIEPIHPLQAWSLIEEHANQLDKPDSENGSDQVTNQVLEVIGTLIYYTLIGEH